MFQNYFCICLALLHFSCINSALARSDQKAWKEEDNIYTKIYDAPIVDTKSGDSASLLQIVHQQPAILALVFTRCTGVCNPLLLQLHEQLEWNALNKNCKIIVASFDPRDSVDDMKYYAEKLGLEMNERWFFVRTDCIDELNASIGFIPIWDRIRQQYDHDALLVGLNTDGYITKKLIGLRNSHDLELLISSTHNIYTPTYRIPTEDMLFSCFNFDPKTGKSTPGWGLIFIALPAVLTALILFTVNYFTEVNRNGVK